MGEIGLADQANAALCEVVCLFALGEFCLNQRIQLAMAKGDELDADGV